ncbi:hypothetical protein F4780DRAFT_748501 [Xylariomycetidae sp. FL0641]|nr:hypothetical protein F4780DRAFT_748501 [Xylariomycetidae sp. FL0641]
MTRSLCRLPPAPLRPPQCLFFHRRIWLPRIILGTRHDPSRLYSSKIQLPEPDPEKVEPGRHVIDWCAKNDIYFPKALGTLRGLKLEDNPYKLWVRASTRKCVSLMHMVYFDSREHPFCRSMFDKYEVKKEREPLWYTIRCTYGQKGLPTAPNIKGRSRMKRALHDALREAGYDHYGRKREQAGKQDKDEAKDKIEGESEGEGEGDTRRPVELSGTIAIKCSSPKELCMANYQDVVAVARNIIAAAEGMMGRDKDGRPLATHIDTTDRNPRKMRRAKPPQSPPAEPPVTQERAKHATESPPTGKRSVTTPGQTYLPKISFKPNQAKPMATKLADKKSHQSADEIKPLQPADEMKSPQPADEKKAPQQSTDAVKVESQTSIPPVLVKKRSRRPKIKYQSAIPPLKVGYYEGSEESQSEKIVTLPTPRQVLMPKINYEPLSLETLSAESKITRRKDVGDPLPSTSLPSSPKVDDESQIVQKQEVDSFPQQSDLPTASDHPSAPPEPQIAQKGRGDEEVNEAPRRADPSNADDQSRPAKPQPAQEAEGTGDVSQREDLSSVSDQSLTPPDSQTIQKGDVMDVSKRPFLPMVNYSSALPSESQVGNEPSLPNRANLPTVNYESAMQSKLQWVDEMLPLREPARPKINYWAMMQAEIAKTPESKIHGPRSGQPAWRKADSQSRKAPKLQTLQQGGKDVSQHHSQKMNQQSLIEAETQTAQGSAKDEPQRPRLTKADEQSSILPEPQPEDENQPPRGPALLEAKGKPTMIEAKTAGLNGDEHHTSPPQQPPLPEDNFQPRIPAGAQTSRKGTGAVWQLPCLPKSDDRSLIPEPQPEDEVLSPHGPKLGKVHDQTTAIAAGMARLEGKQDQALPLQQPSLPEESHRSSMKTETRTSQDDIKAIGRQPFLPKVVYSSASPSQPLIEESPVDPALRRAKYRTTTIELQLAKRAGARLQQPSLSEDKDQPSTPAEAQASQQDAKGVAQRPDLPEVNKSRSTPNESSWGSRRQRPYLPKVKY